MSGVQRFASRSRTRERAFTGAVRACAFALIVGAVPARSADTDAGTTFLQKAAQANAAEIKTSQAAQTRAVAPAVKAFADRMDLLRKSLATNKRTPSAKRASKSATGKPKRKAARKTRRKSA